MVNMPIAPFYELLSIVHHRPMLHQQTIHSVAIDRKHLLNFDHNYSNEDKIVDGLYSR